MAPELGRIFGELSWTSRLQLLDKYYPVQNRTVMSMESLMQTVAPELIAYDKSYSRSYNKPPRLPALPDVSHGPPGQQPRQQRNRRAGQPRRGVGISALKQPGRLVAGRRQTPSGDPPTNPAPSRDDETSMKLKLFRLMYETVRDSDLKVKRAELIKTQYTNSSAFEVGYLLGDISDKYNIMSDIASTLQRLYGDWRPIEHINAYEQIANQAIEISHLIDLAKTVHKRNEKSVK